MSVFSVPEMKSIAMAYGSEVQFGRVADGHGGPGFYVWSAEYSDEGSTFLTDSESEFIELASSIASELSAIMTTCAAMPRQGPAQAL